MRRLIVRLAVALCTFALGFAAVALRSALWPASERVVVGEFNQAPRPHAGRHADALSPDPNASASAHSPILAYCELANNPERYDGQIVRVRARLVMSTHGLMLHDAACADWDKQAAVTFPGESLVEIEDDFTEAGAAKEYWHAPHDVIVAGRFEEVTPSGESDLLLHTLPLHFKIMRVEKASPERRAAGR